MREVKGDRVFSKINAWFFQLASIERMDVSNRAAVPHHPTFSASHILISD